jgi:hypothetical protein
MSLEVDYLPVATATGANVDSQANFQGSTYQEDGFQVGIAQPYQINKILRQTSMIAAAVANFISNELNTPILDDGNLATLITNLTNAIIAAAKAAAANIVSVPFSGTPVFDASQGSKFEIVLTGNVTSSTLINITPGQSLKFIVKQDATGGHAFVPPANLPMPAIDQTASATNIQNFIVDSGSNVYADGAIAVN